MRYFRVGDIVALRTDSFEWVVTDVNNPNATDIRVARITYDGHQVLRDCFPADALYLVRSVPDCE